MYFVLFFISFCTAQLYNVGTSQGYAFNPAFDTAITTYSIDVPNSETELTFVPVAHDALEVFLDDC